MSDEPSISQHARGSYIAQAAHGGSATVNVVLPPPAVREQNRVRMLSRLRYRYDEQWEQSLEGAGLLTLGFASKPDAVLHHTGLLFLSPHQPERPLPPGTSIAQVYEQAGQELLILGEPGAGKSMLLLDLARWLVERAEQDAAQPFPVILPLSSWAVKRQPLTDWLSEQVTRLYGVPPRLSHAWVQTDQLLLLLDGFDEVPQQARIACLQAIAAYRQEHLVPLVLCSRRSEFEAIPRQQRLVMQSAVVVQPLTQEQVGDYLLEGGEAFSALRTVLQSNPVLQELVTTPLMVHILTHTYTGSKARDLPQGGSPEEQQRSIFANYIERMIERRRNRISFPLQRVIPWLIWLARQMQQRSQTVFYLEQMQPNWLPEGRLSQTYERLAVRLPGMLIGVLGSLVGAILLLGPFNSTFVYILFGLLGGLIGGLFSGRNITRQSAERRLGSWKISWRHFIVGPLRNGLLVGLSSGLIAGRSAGLTGGVYFGLTWGLSSVLLSVIFKEGNAAQPQTERQVRSWRGLWQRLVNAGHVWNALLVGLITGLSAGLSYGLIAGLFNGLRFGLVFGLITGLNNGVSFGLIGLLLSVILVGRDRTIQPAEIIVSSRRSIWQSLINGRHVRNALLVGLSFGLIGGLTWGLSFELSVGLTWGLSFGSSFGLIYWLLLGLFNGLSSDTLDERRRIMPNEGIRRSAQNALRVGLISGFVSSLIIIPSYGLSFGLLGGLSEGLLGGLLSGLVGGLAIGLLAGLLNGGLACIRHGVLRWLLWRNRCIPWNYVRFLDFAAERILLRKVGGGYIFLHRLLLDYFANLETQPGSDASAESRQERVPSETVPCVEPTGADECSDVPTVSLAPTPVPSEVPRLLPCGHEWRPHACFCSVCGTRVPS